MTAHVPDQRGEHFESAIGRERTERFTVEGKLLTEEDDGLPARVLSTPGMLDRMEAACTNLVREQLIDGRATVGSDVNIRHVGSAAEGTDCETHVRLVDVVDDSRLRFDVEVRQGDRVLGFGSHERRVIAVPAVSDASRP